MARIVLGMATTHGPQLHTTADLWPLRVKADRTNRHPFRGRIYSFDELVARRKEESLELRSSPEAMQTAATRCQTALLALADKWDEVKPDVAIIFGNDQDEIYETDQLSPPFMVFIGDTIPNYCQTEEQRQALEPGLAEAEPGYATPQYVEYEGLPPLALHIVNSLTENDFDVAVSRTWPKPARNGVSHAFGHVYRQVMRDNVVPSVPIYQNTFYPPNQPTAKRAYAFGQVVGQAIRSWESDSCVAVIASGGMSHFVIDEEIDRAFIAALRRKDKEYLTSIPLETLQSGTSELKSWISLAGALEPAAAEMHELDYVPCYRSAAGTGSANGFFWWSIDGADS